MPTISHKNIADSQLHECKGAAGASTGKVLIATGSGTATFRYINQRGFVYFFNTSTPYNLTYPSSFTKVNPVTTGSGNLIEVLEGIDAKLTFTTGVSGNVYATITAKVCVSQSSGSDKDIILAIYKNGTIVGGSQSIVTTVTGKKEMIVSTVHTPLSPNDYIEAYIKNDGGAGDLNIYSYTLGLTATRG